MTLLFAYLLSLVSLLVFVAAALFVTDRLDRPKRGNLGKFDNPHAV